MVRRWAEQGRELCSGSPARVYQPDQTGEGSADSGRWLALAAKRGGAEQGAPDPRTPIPLPMRAPPTPTPLSFRGGGDFLSEATWRADRVLQPRPSASLPPKFGGGWQCLAGFPSILGSGQPARRYPRIEGKPWAVFAGSHEVAWPCCSFQKNLPPKVAAAGLPGVVAARTGVGRTGNAGGDD